MRHRTAQKRHFRHSGELKIGEVLAFAFEIAAVFLAPHRRSDPLPPGLYGLSA